MDPEPLVLPTDPKANYLAHKNEIDEAVHRVLCSGRYILGREVSAFEEEFARYLGVQHAVGVGSGTDALHLALRASGIGPGDTVVTVSHTAVATVAAIDLAGAVPLLVDIDPVTFTMDPNRLEDAIRQRTGGRIKAVIPVHLYGHPADMPAIMEIANRHGQYVIEDCAQSHGALLNGRKTGAWGHMAAFSFYPTKNLGALGDGGMVVTSDSELAQRIRMLRQYGWLSDRISQCPGANSRLDEIQAAILRVKLRYLVEENAGRRRWAAVYRERLQGVGVDLPAEAPGAFHCYHQFVVRSTVRDSLRAFLRARGIETAIHYPVPVHLQPAYRGRIGRSGALAETERAAGEILSLPMYSALALKQVELVTAAIEELTREARVPRDAS